ncbi:MAG: branched-chain amino acid ABC transporter substrate-binding protein [Gammaproteobacteria bacterium]|nr:branched-chain amino acid ABC transporter substrate-binding protein [Gammaproteobacteria bacterium]
MKTRLVPLMVGLLLSAAAQADIHIGVAGAMTGPAAPLGEQFFRGAEMAVADLNAKGGVLGQKVVIEKADDACDPKQAVAVANQMANKRVVFVDGHLCSGASIPASDVYNEEGILQISPSATNPMFTDRGLKYVFRACGRDDQQGAIAGEYIAKHFKNARVAILNDKSAYGKGLADETKKALNKLGKQETLYEAITAGEKDYSALVSKLKAAKIDLIYLGGYHTEAGLIVRQAREQGLKATLMSGDGLMTDEYWSITGPAGEGTLMTFSPDLSRNANAKPVAEKFLKQGYKPAGFTLYSYGTIQAWAQAVEAAKSTKAADVARVLKSGKKFDTVIGSIGFDSKGDVTAPGYVVYEWKNGKYDYAKK